MNKERAELNKKYRQKIKKEVTICMGIETLLELMKLLFNELYQLK